jgi:hypothetical protein
MHSSKWARVISPGRLALLLVLALCTASRPAASLVWGANGHPFTAYPGVSVDRQLAYLNDLGLKSYRVNISELRSAPALGELIAKAEPLGIAILPVLTPALDLEALSAEALRAGAYELAFALVSQFKQKVRVWELGNELENFAIIQPCEKRDDGTQYPCEWGPAGGVGPLDYYGPRWAKVSAVMKGLVEGAAAADPTVRKAMGTAGWGHIGAFERMKRDGIAWDISVWHMYGEDPEWAFKALAAYDRPIWVTEMNHPGGSSKGEEDQAEGLKRWMLRLAELAPRYRIEAVHLYELMDETYWAPDFEAVMGLVRLEKEGASWRPGAPKAAYDAVRSLARGEAALAMPPRGCDPDSSAPGLAGLDRQVAQAFCLLLGRNADGAGLKSWADERRGGMDVVTMLRAMTGSDEFARRYRTDFLSDANYIALLYRLLLDRMPDGDGLADYTAQLRGRRLTRLDLAGSILTSDEFKARHPHFFAPPT